MTVPYRFTIQSRIRLGQWLSLIFFVCLLTQRCRQKEDKIAIIWNGKQAIGITFPKKLAGDAINNSSEGLLVRLAGNTTAMLGNYKITDDQILFTPLIPFSPGSAYEVIYKKNQIGTIQVPAPNAEHMASVINVFPTVDTLPENLLKIYVQFSAPMREGEALQHIYLQNEHNDTVPGVFLDLQPELWDTSRTVLTVWLDPGRIKRDLIPNRKLGSPLQQGKHYTISIYNNWKDAQGLLLRQSFNRKFIAGSRDSISPQPEQWKLELPAANTNRELKINFGESLDYYLLQETIRITDEKGQVMMGSGTPFNNGTGFAFWPDQPWKAGRYRMQVASYLEDLAGNNLNRLFDRDLQVKKVETDEEFMERKFVIK